VRKRARARVKERGGEPERERQTGECLLSGSCTGLVSLSHDQEGRETRWGTGRL